VGKPMSSERHVTSVRSRAAIAAVLAVTACTADGTRATPRNNPPTPAVASASASPPPPPPPPAAAAPLRLAEFGSIKAMRPKVGPNGVRTRVGCLPDLSAATLDKEFKQRIGPMIGWDNPHVYPLGGDRWLWLVHDTYLDYVGGATRLSDGSPQLQNIALIQNGRCFSILHRGDLTLPTNFEPGVGAVAESSFFWPLGGELHRGKLRIFWSNTAWDPALPGPGDGLQRHPLSTWIGVYDPLTLERLSFRPAPNDGVFPQYGFAVASQGRCTYLFGNSNLLNLAREGGFYEGPHSATRTYLARVPYGRLRADPQYRTEHGWSSDPANAVPISQRFWAANTMQPRYIDGQWIAVTKVDEFWGVDVVIDVAEHPWGPWVTVERFRHRQRYRAELTNSYQPILLPWRDPSGGLIVVISENAQAWSDAIERPPLYRPAAFTVDWPLPE